MAILDLDKVVFQKTIIGINCKVCGGSLFPKSKKSLTEKLITAFTFGIIKTKLYQYERCKKFHTVILRSDVRKSINELSENFFSP